MHVLSLSSSNFFEAHHYKIEMMPGGYVNFSHPEATLKMEPGQINFYTKWEVRKLNPNLIQSKSNIVIPIDLKVFEAHHSRVEVSSDWVNIFTPNTEIVINSGQIQAYTKVAVHRNRPLVPKTKTELEMFTNSTAAMNQDELIDLLKVKKTGDQLDNDMLLLGPTPNGKVWAVMPESSPKGVPYRQAVRHMNALSARRARGLNNFQLLDLTALNFVYETTGPLRKTFKYTHWSADGVERANPETFNFSNGGRKPFPQSQNCHFRTASLWGYLLPQNP